MQNLAGQAKESLGRATGDKDTENRGKGDQAKSNLKDAGEKVTSWRGTRAPEPPRHQDRALSHPSVCVPAKGRPVRAHT